jgi:Txe/YoeB family toxin of Txe-Axe toxin-antitoxin module
MKKQIILLKEARRIYYTLKKKNKSILIKAINNKLHLIEVDPSSGIRIQKKLIPKEYLNKYKLDNLWKINLPEGWRMLYTIKGDEIEIIAFVLEILDHKKYEERFKY